MGWATRWATAPYYPPYYPTPPEIVRRMLKIAGVGLGDVVYDLGCGDGRILIMAVKDFGAKKAVGYEIREGVYSTALWEVERLGLLDKIRLVKGDLFEADLSEATVITLYLNESTSQRLKPKLEREMRDGTRIVSCAYQLLGWKPIKNERCHGDTIYLYTVPESVNLVQ